MGALEKELAAVTVSPERMAKERRLGLIREKRIRLARIGLWEYCRIESPDFYTVNNWHLEILCWVLQNLYEKTLTKARFLVAANRIAPAWWVAQYAWDDMPDDVIFTRLMINVPPRTGKSRTLVNFCKWAFGKNRRNKIITGSYNDEMAQDFSRYTRDGIQQTKTFPHEITYRDIFPETDIKRGDASYGKWALDGSFFSYKGAGVGGSVTGKGCNISIVDDPVKDAEEAFNDNRLETIWRWYSGTFKSRREKGSIEIVNMTRWANKDICGRILDNKKRAREWFVLKMSAQDEATGEMLAPALLDKAMYEELRDTVDESIFNANYKQEPVDKKGRLYKEFRTYAELPVDEKGAPVWERIINYTDTADTGGDYLASIVAGVYQGYGYILDVLYTKAPMEETEPQAAAMIHANAVKLAKIESNNGGRGFARNVERELWEKHGTRAVKVTWFHQGKNKQARILTNSNNVQRLLFFPADWASRWPDYYKALNEHKAEGKNLNDDAADATTGIVEMLERDSRTKAKAVQPLM